MFDYRYDQRVNNAIGVTAFILAGGKSSRMSSDKAFLQLGGETLLAHALKLAGAVADDVRIVGDAAKFSALAILATLFYCTVIGFVTFISLLLADSINGLKKKED